MKKVLFVCTGNTCRSSMAEAVAKSLLKEMDREGDIEFSSAGIYAIPGEKATPQAIAALDQLGIDLSLHCSRRLEKNLIDESDIILAMTSSHKALITAMWPEVKPKLHTISEFADEGYFDILDPIGQPVEAYKNCALKLKGLIAKIIDRIIKAENK